MARIITKGLIGQEDLNVGTSTFTRATSTGGTQVLHQISLFQVGSVTPTGVVNGVNVTFTVSPVPVAGLFLLLFRNGLLQTIGGANDYTLSGGTITFNVAPLTNDVLVAVY